jgi:hypothetical protein
MTEEVTQHDNFELQLSVARIEGMLSSTLARHGERLDSHEGTLGSMEVRMREKGNTIARHDERIRDLEEDNSGRLGRITGTIGALVGIAAQIHGG